MPTPTLSFDELISQAASFLDFTDTDVQTDIELTKSKVWFLLNKFVSSDYIDFDDYTTNELMVAAEYVAYLMVEKQTQRMGLSATSSSQNLFIKKEKVDVLEREFSERKGVLTVSELLSSYKYNLCIAASEMNWILPICDTGDCLYSGSGIGIFYPNPDDYLF